MTPGPTRWLVPRRMRPDLWALIEPGFVTSWLLTGSDRALLVDTGTGIERMRPVVEAITPAPVVVVNTHHHSDHVGGNREFDDVRIHAAGAERLGLAPNRAMIAGVLDWMRTGAAAVAAASQDVLMLIEQDDLPRPLPDGVRTEELGRVPGAPTGTLAEGDVLDLGGYSVRVLHTPGHSGDGISLLEERHGLLFAGDTLDPHDLLAQYADSSLTDFVASTRRLQDLQDSLSVVLMSHSSRAHGELTLIDDARNALECVAAQEAELSETIDFAGGRVLEATVGRLTVQIAPPGGPALDSVVQPEEDQ